MSERIHSGNILFWSRLLFSVRSSCCDIGCPENRLCSQKFLYAHWVLSIWPVQYHCKRYRLSFCLLLETNSDVQEIRFWPFLFVTNLYPGMLSNPEVACLKSNSILCVLYTARNARLSDLFWSNVCKCGECPFKRCALERRVNVCPAIWGCLCSEFSASPRKGAESAERRAIIKGMSDGGCVCMTGPSSEPLSTVVHSTRVIIQCKVKWPAMVKNMFTYTETIS